MPPSHPHRVRCALLLTLAGPLLAMAATGDKPDAHDPDALWAGGGHGVIKRAADDGAPLETLPGRLERVRALAVDPRTGTAWVSDGRTLTHLAPAGAVRWTVPLVRRRHRHRRDARRGRNAGQAGRDRTGRGQSNVLAWNRGPGGARPGNGGGPGGTRAPLPGTPGASLRLVAGGNDGSVWVITRTAAIRFDADGERAARIRLWGPVTAATLDRQRDRLWLATPRHVAAFDAGGQQVATLHGVPVPAAVRALAYAPHRDALWVATLGRVRRFGAVAGTAAGSLPAYAVEHLAADGRGGLWAEGWHRLQHFDASGALAFALRDPIGWGPAIDLVANPADQSAWLAGTHELAHVRADGAVDHHERLPRHAPPGRIAALGLFADVIPPALTIDTPADGALLATTTPTLGLAFADVGSGVDPASLALRVNATAIASTCTPAAGTADCVPTDALAQGGNTLAATVKDYAGNTSEPTTVHVRIDTIAPTITFTGDLVPGFVTNDADSTVDGDLSEPATVTVAGAPAGDPVEHFEQPVALTEGDNHFTVTATDAAGNMTTRTLAGVLDTQPPVAPAGDGLTVELADSQATLTAKAGAAEPGATVTITNERTGESVTVQADGDGAFVATIAAQAGDTFSVTATDAAGNDSDATEITAGYVPPDPATVAPPLPKTGTPPFDQQVSFLYEGAHPIQQDVAPGTIEKRRISVMRGSVHDRNGDPIPGVAITIAHHPELGHTGTQASGEFDLAVNGGGPLTIEYRKDGYLPVQRTVSTQWHGWYHADDVVMIPQDDKVTTIELADTSQAIQVARGSVEHDSDGTRQATILFPRDTTAAITLPDGSNKQLGQIDVRATEYTVGDTGPNAMPGDLPPSSAYTYAVDLSVDQQREQGVEVHGKGVTFNQAIPVYVDNFLGFPTGEAVPVGYYDDQKAAWIPSDNGRIVELLDEQNGHAILDVTGDGEPATQDELDAVDITAAELHELARLYDPGDSLWRFTTKHLSIWDCNWPYGLPLGARGPNVKRPSIDHKNNTDNSDDDNRCPGCMIDAQQQSLGESVPIAGTAFSLHYQSDRQPANKRNRVTIPLTDSDIPDTLKSVELDITIAGQTKRLQFSPDADQTYTFTWTGLDGFGRRRYGTATATIRLKYFYPCRYLAPKPHTGFAGYGQQLQAIGPKETARCRGFIFVRTSSLTLQSPFSRPVIGNWTISRFNKLDRLRGKLDLGNGKTRKVVRQTIDTFAGSGQRRYTDRPATELKLDRPRAVAAASNGTIYIADRYGGYLWAVQPDGIVQYLVNRSTIVDSFTDLAVGPNGDVYAVSTLGNRVYRVGSDGSVQVIAGSTYGNTAFYESGKAAGDGGPASDADLYRPEGIAVGKDSSVYVTDAYAGVDRIRKIRPDGRINTIARIEGANGIAIGPNGGIYVTCGRCNRVYHITSDGKKSVFAGTGNPGFSGDYGPAIQADFHHTDGVSVDADGAVYIVDKGNQRVRRVDINGVVTTVAGNGSAKSSGDGGPAGNAGLQYPEDVAIDGAARIYIDARGGNRVRVVTPGSVKASSDGYTVSARGGRKRFVFDYLGRHIRTVNAQTGALMYRFQRDSNGHLQKIIDGDGNTTTIDRDSNGRATAIVAPDGQRTELTIDSHGHLTRATDPTGAGWSMAYTTGGLLTQFTDRTGAQHSYTYDSDGHLTGDRGPKGTGWTLARTSITNGHQVDMTSGAGRQYRFALTRPIDGKRVYTNTAPDGTVTTRTETDAGDTSIEEPDGTHVTRSEGPDPRFGFTAPVTKKTSITTPAGLVRTVERARTADVPDAGDVTQPDQLTRSVTVNGRTTQSVYDGPSRTWTTTTPAGRQATTTTDAQGRPTTTQIGPFAPIARAYGARGRPSTITRTAEGTTRTTQFAYTDSGPGAGYLASITGPMGRTVTYTRDADGRVTQQTRPDGSTIGFAYDPEGRLTEVDPPGRPTHVMTYDGNGDRTRYAPPNVDGNAAVTHYHFNADKQLTEVDRPDGKTVTLAYDSAGKRSTVTSPAGTWTYGYDATSGKLANIQAPGGESLSFTRDGSLLTQTRWSGPVPGTVGYTYDDSFRPTQQTVDGQAIAFGYDADSLLTQAGNLSITRAANHPGITSTTLGDVTTTRGYNGFGELQARTAEAGGNSVYSATYNRDAAGRIAEVTRSVEGDSHTWDYTYGNAARLTKVTRDGTPVHIYHYGPNGNRTSHTGPSGTTTATYDDRDRLVQYGNTDYTYNAAGDLTQTSGPQGTTSYDYDAFGNLRGATQPDGTKITYVIDGENRRVGKKVDGTLEQGWLYQDGLNPVAQTDGQGNVTERFVYGTKPNVPAYMIKDGTTYRFITDPRGSVRLVVNTDTGAIVQRIDYSPFGKVITDTNPGFQPFGFAGGLYDPSTGLVRFGARDYEPETGRWTATDPILFAGGQLDLYSYVIDDPVNSVDYAGLGPADGVPANGPAADAIHKQLMNAVQFRKTGLVAPRPDIVPRGVGDIKSYYYLNHIPDPYAQSQIRAGNPDYDPYAHTIDTLGMCDVGASE